MRYGKNEYMICDVTRNAERNKKKNVGKNKMKEKEKSIYINIITHLKMEVRFFEHINNNNSNRILTIY